MVLFEYFGVPQPPFIVFLPCLLVCLNIAQHIASTNMKNFPEKPPVLTFLLAFVGAATIYLLPSIALAHHALGTVYAAPLVIALAGNARVIAGHKFQLAPAPDAPKTE